MSEYRGTLPGGVVAGTVNAPAAPIAAQLDQTAHRAEFEREAMRLDIIDDEGLERRESGEYVDEPAQAAWLVWQATRTGAAQLDAELPPPDVCKPCQICDGAGHFYGQTCASCEGAGSITNNEDLPALPKPEATGWHFGRGEGVRGYTAEQFRQGQRDAIAPYAERIGHLTAELERAQAAFHGSENARKVAERAYIDDHTAPSAAPIAWLLKTGHGNQWRTSAPTGEFANKWIPLVDGRSAGTAPEAALEAAAKLAIKFTAVPRDVLGPATVQMKTLAAVGEKIATAIRALGTAGAVSPKPCRNCAGFGWEPSIDGERRPCGFCKAAAPSLSGTEDK